MGHAGRMFLQSCFMKQLAFLLVIAISGSHAFAQPLHAHASADTAKCPPSFSSPVYPTIGAPAGGVPPYIYSWTNGNLLDSPNSAQPRIVQHASQTVDSLFFVVQVTDAANTIARDTVRVLFSHWAFTLGQCIRFKGTGDTVSIASQGGSINFFPTTLEWTPNVYLDSNAFGHRSFTPVTQNYIVYGTDRAGCRLSAGSCSVIVSATRVPVAASSESAVRIIPSPATSDSRIEISNDLLGGKMHIFSLDGRTVRTLLLQSTSTPLADATPIPPGHYFYRIARDGAPPVTGRLILQK